MLEPRRAVMVAVLTLMVAPHALAAQGERVSIRPRPAPDQTIRLKLTQEMNMEMTVVGSPAAGGSPAGPMRTVGTIVFEGTQRVTGPDAEGRVSAGVTYDQVTSTMTMNGRPASQDVTDTLTGKTFTTVFDAQGKVVDFTVPEDLAAIGPSVKEMMTLMIGGLLDISLSVGETITTPLDVALPVPVPASPTMRMAGERTVTLVSVSRADGDRVASLEQGTITKLTRSMEMPGPNGSATVSVDFATQSTGVTMWNLDRGYVVSSDLTSTTDGTISGPIGMTIHGTIRIVTAGTRIR